jgi:hypothetical protein
MSNLTPSDFMVLGETITKQVNMAKVDFQNTKPQEDKIDMRDYGRLEGKVEQLADDMREIKLSVDELKSMMQTAKGGWKMMLTFVGVLTSLGAGVAWFLDYIKLKG